MKRIHFLLPVLFLPFLALGCRQAVTMSSDTEYRPLTAAEKAVILDKGTERPFSGEYNQHFAEGTYLCKLCRTPLYRSDDKFASSCGWPSFDDEIPGAVLRLPDPDGRRTEIVCNSCGAHLGHVFLGEGFAAKDTRHCVNLISLAFVAADEEARERALFAAGCFWGVQYYFDREPGVLATASGYSGGRLASPAYRDVLTGTTGHAETVEVVFDPRLTSFEKLARLFFSIHDFSQVDRQGPDIGNQYRSAVFYLNEGQRAITEKLVKVLTARGLKVATRVEKAGPFWPGEDYHQHYYDRKGGLPYCHVKRRVFD